MPNAAAGQDATADVSRGQPASGATRIDPRLDPEAWVSNNERITNEADREGWLAIYAPDAVLETLTEGLYERAQGIDAICAAIDIYAPVFTARGLKVEKRLVSASAAVVVNAWTGGFGGKHNQRGIEAFRLRDGLVVHHEMYTFLDVRPSTSLFGRLRSLLYAPGEMLSLARETARTKRA